MRKLYICRYMKYRWALATGDGQHKALSRSAYMALIISPFLHASNVLCFAFLSLCNILHFAFLWTFLFHWRGPDLLKRIFFEYCALCTVRTIIDRSEQWIGNDYYYYYYYSSSSCYYICGLRPLKSILFHIFAAVVSASCVLCNKETEWRTHCVRTKIATLYIVLLMWWCAHAFFAMTFNTHSQSSGCTWGYRKITKAIFKKSYGLQLYIWFSMEMKAIFWSAVHCASGFGIKPNPVSSLVAWIKKIITIFDLFCVSLILHFVDVGTVFFVFV